MPVSVGSYGSPCAFWVTPVKDAAWLRWIEQSLGRPEPGAAGGDASRLRFRCCLEEQPDHLVPAYSLRDQARSARPNLIVNPACCFGREDGWPAELSRAVEPLFDSRSGQRDLVCVRDPATDLLQPFSLGPALSALLAGVRPGDPAPSELPGESRSVLAAAGVLVPDDWAEICNQKWVSGVSRGTQVFRQQGFVPLRRLIHPFHIAALRRYYRHLIRSGFMPMGDGQCARRYIAHNEPVASFFHYQLIPVVAALVGESIKPSYVYVGSYQEGAVLEKHIDREQCEFSVSLCLDYAPEPRLATPWPIQLHTPSGMTTVFQAMGDGLLYRGCNIPHSRGTLPRGHTSTSAFFHYVAKGFADSLN
jgi:hypothetical protein